jgi:hypothetical protein
MHAMQFNRDRVQENIRQAETLDLLDRITAYRAGMEPEAIAMIEEELRRRHVSDQEIRAHAEAMSRQALTDEQGLARRCSFCNRPAVSSGWTWHRLWGFLPLFPRRVYYCTSHAPHG